MNPIEERMRKRLAVLRERAAKYEEKLEPIHLEMRQLLGALDAMSAPGGEEPSDVEPRLRLLSEPAADLVYEPEPGIDRDVLRAYSNATEGALKEVGIPKGTVLKCSEEGHEALDFGNQVALEFHARKHHGREPKPEERVPR